MDTFLGVIVFVAMAYGLNQTLSKAKNAATTAIKERPAETMAWIKCFIDLKRRY